MIEYIRWWRRYRGRYGRGQSWIITIRRRPSKRPRNRSIATRRRGYGRGCLIRSDDFINCDASLSAGSSIAKPFITTTGMKSVATSKQNPNYVQPLERWETHPTHVRRALWAYFIPSAKFSELWELIDSQPTWRSFHNTSRRLIKWVNFQTLNYMCACNARMHSKMWNVCSIKV